MFETIPGNDQIKVYLRTAVKKGAIGQSLLFTGSDIEVMGQFALELASSTLSHQGTHHPDLHIYHPEGKLGMHTIEAMRRMSEEVYLSPFEGHRKVFVIFQAERMLPTSSNALLKTFEEPAEDTLIILLSDQPEHILPTIRSRCRIVRFHGESTHEPLNDVPGLFDELQAVLNNRRFGTYKQLTAHTEKIGSLFDGHKKERAKLLREQMLSAFSAKATQSQSEAIEKESEGIAAMEAAAIVKRLLELVVCSYRGSEHNITVEGVVEHVNQAQLAYQRSTSLSLCLETLFIKLGKI